MYEKCKNILTVRSSLQAVAEGAEYTYCHFYTVKTKQVHTVFGVGSIRREYVFPGNYIELIFT